MNAQYTVFGHPIAHSKSPYIHECFAQQEGIKIDYTRTWVENTPMNFAQAVKTFFTQGGLGANVTLPFKQYALDVCDSLSERAQTAGAVNTLIPQDDGTLLGENTDGIGLVQDLCQQLNWDLRNQRILILGAGGAARGIILPLLDCAPSHITLANRNVDKAQILARQFGIEAQSFAGLTQSFDVVINATSSSVVGEVPPISTAVFENSKVYDLFYAAETTIFLRYAQQYGAQQIADGLGMLVGQAAQAYYLWRGFMPQTALVLAQLKREMYGHD